MFGHSHILVPRQYLLLSFFFLWSLIRRTAGNNGGFCRWTQAALVVLVLDSETTQSKRAGLKGWKQADGRRPPVSHSCVTEAACFPWAPGGNVLRRMAPESGRTRVVNLASSKNQMVISHTRLQPQPLKRFTSRAPAMFCFATVTDSMPISRGCIRMRKLFFSIPCQRVLSTIMRLV